MSEFKGTNNELEIRGNQLFLKDSHISVLTAHVRKKNLLDFNTEDIEQKANLLLWSKAPEMLEMLQRCLNVNDIAKQHISQDLFNDLEQLIKEATEL